MLDLLLGGGLTPSGAFQPPQVCIDPSPEKIVKISQEYIADAADPSGFPTNRVLIESQVYDLATTINKVLLFERL